VSASSPAAAPSGRQRRGRYDIDRAALAAVLGDQPAYRVEQVWHGLYRDLVDVETLSTLPKNLRARLATDLPSSLDEVERREADRGQTVKFLWRLADGALIETVLMHYRDRSTVCVSTQAGCAMACGFCATGQAGFERHLEAGEIVEQVVRAAQVARPRRVDNVVLMGMGEPLANYDRVWAALTRLHGDVGISARHLTVSTVGIVPGIRRMAEEPLPVNLAVSLHAANDELRDELVPINRRYPLEDLLGALEGYRAAKRRRISFEWSLIDGVNDRDSDAAELAVLARRVGAHVNLIPLNPTPGYGVAGTPPAAVEAFRDHLAARGVNVTVRRTRGTDIDAACGQLRASAVGGTAGGGTAVPVPVAPPRSRSGAARGPLTD
jgi:23S rRNA (adenine2503-C2)-methyltransferase